MNIAKIFAKKVKKKVPDAVIIFFGSCARGDNTLESDFDFIIVSDCFKNINFFKRMPLIYDI
ncbi:MAG: nucleotidyltransferase domain-containing protein [Promethearchaeota archaeon]